MKKFIILFVALFASHAAFAQNTITFKGKVIPNEKYPEVEVKEAMKTIASFKINSDGTYYGEMPLDRMKQISLTYGDCGQPIFAKPGREITVNMGSTNKSVSLFTGSPETDLYIDMRFTFYPSDISIIWDMPWHVYKKYQQDAMVSMMKYSEAFCMAHPDIPASYRKEVEEFNRYANYGSFIMWPQQYKARQKVATFEGEDDYAVYLKSLFEKIEWNDPFLCNIPQFVSFAEYAMNESIKEAGGKRSFLLDAFDYVQKNIENKTVRDFFMMHYVKKYMKDENEAAQAEIESFFRKHVADTRYLSQLEEVLKESKRFGNNAPASDFTLEDVNGKMITLSQFKGKVVYIDFWATWCAPCRGEIPHMNKLKEELKGNKDIVIICVSTDQVKDKGKWKEMVAEMGMGEYQVFAGEHADEIKKNYNVRGIPHFTIIDKEGKIYKNMTVRPSNPQTKSILLELAK